VGKLVLEPNLKPIFLLDSYGYEPGKSALDVVGVTRNALLTVRLASRI
jgi:retron-type reverse transcriptase